MSSRTARFASLAFFSSFLGLSLLGCAAGTETRVQGKPSSGDGTSLSGDDTTSASGTSASGPGARDTSAPAASTGPIEIRNLSVSSAGSSAEITFVVQNGGSVRIDRVQEVTITDGHAASFMTQCRSASYLPWHVAPGQTSSVITLALSDYGDGSPSLSTPCGDAYGDMTTKPWAGTLTVELKGLLTDATPWRARATTTL